MKPTKSLDTRHKARTTTSRPPVARVQHPAPVKLAILPKSGAVDEVLAEIHFQVGSWGKVSKQLGGVNRGTLSEVASGKRKATRELIDNLNHVYGCSIPYPSIEVTPCARCGAVHVTKRCTASEPKYAPRPAMRWRRFFINSLQIFRCSSH